MAIITSICFVIIRIGMTLCTTCRVISVELKIFVMIEGSRFPLVGIVAFRTTGSDCQVQLIIWFVTLVALQALI